MPEILPGLPPELSGPVLSLPTGELPAELLAGLKAGDSLSARVLMQVAAQRYLLLIGGKEVLADARLALAPGDRLALVVRQAGQQMLLDLVPLKHPSGARTGGTGEVARPAASAAANKPEPAGAPAPPPGGGVQEEPVAAVAPRALRAELQSALSRGAPLGELVAEALRSLTSSEPPTTGTSAPAAAAQPAPPAAAPAIRELIAQLRELLVQLPAPAGTVPAPAASAAGPAPVPAEQAAQAVASQLPEVAAAVPARVAGLLAAVEARAAEVLRALPGAAALAALVEVLDALAARAAQASPAGAPAASPALTPELRQELAPLLQKLLDALGPAAPAEPRAPALPAALREAVEQLTDGQRSALRQMVVERERALLGSSSQVAMLAGAHRALTAADERVELARLWNLSASTGGQSFSYVEIPVAAGPEARTARLTVMVRKATEDGGRGKSAAGGTRTVRAVLDLDLSALGQVWSELNLSGQNLAVKLELPDEARSQFVAARLDELKARLDSRGLESRVVAGARAPRRHAGAHPPEGESAEGGGLNLWA